MTRYLLATDSVNVSAAACDYLDNRIETTDEVIAVAVTGDELGSRDANDALNVARVRLATPDVETIERAGDAGSVIRELVRERDVDIVLLGSPGAGRDDVLLDVVSNVERPVVVLPDDR